ncbi:MAG: hypothetical protein M3Y77_17990 [Actinomycetota bacterium]|nr:hypothetical protein [Actinomycetota bacterium]
MATAALLLAGCGSNSTSTNSPAAGGSSAPSTSAPAVTSAAGGGSAAASGGGSAAASGGGSAEASGGGTGAATGAGLKIGQSSLGNIVVDGAGMSLYLFTKDTKGSGKSSCTGQCLATWPPLVAAGTPTGDGITGTLGTIPTPDGKKQVTLNGWPLYHFAADKAPGDVKGQGIKGSWWVVTSAGVAISAAASSAASSSASGSGNNGYGG